MRTSGVIGPFIDQETILSFKNLLGALGSPNLFIQNGEGLFYQHPQSTGLIDFRSNYLIGREAGIDNALGASSAGMGSLDYILLVGTNPRLEASLLNVGLRKLHKT